MRAHDWEALLLPELRQALPEFAGSTLTLAAQRPSRGYTYSEMHFFMLLADGRAAQELAVKELRANAQQEAQSEFEGMQRLWAHLAGHDSIRAPRPLFFLDQPQALVMEAVQGERLNRVVAGCRRPQRGSRFDRTLLFLRRAGEGLALLHQAAPAAGAVLLPPPLQRLQTALERLQGLGIADGELAALRRDLEPLLQAIPPDSPTVTLHGDYTLRNVLCAGSDKIAILDTALNVVGPPAHDIGYFLAALAFTDRWHLLAGRLAYSPATITAMRQAFLSGSGPAPGLDANQLALYTALRLLERWAQYAETMQANPSAAARLLLRVRGHGHFSAAVAVEVEGTVQKRQELSG